MKYYKPQFLFHFEFRKGVCLCAFASQAIIQETVLSFCFTKARYCFTGKTMVLDDICVYGGDVMESADIQQLKEKCGTVRPIGHLR